MRVRSLSIVKSLYEIPACITSLRMIDFHCTNTARKQCLWLSLLQLIVETIVEKKKTPEKVSEELVRRVCKLLGMCFDRNTWRKPVSYQTDLLQGQMIQYVINFENQMIAKCNCLYQHVSSIMFFVFRHKKVTILCSYYGVLNKIMFASLVHKILFQF